VRELGKSRGAPKKKNQRATRKLGGGKVVGKFDPKKKQKIISTLRANLEAAKSKTAQFDDVVTDLHRAKQTALQSASGLSSGVVK